MPVMTEEDRDYIHEFTENLKKRYPDCRVINDIINHEVRVLEEDLTFRYPYILMLKNSKA
jgi:hypothetical protein